MTLPAVLSSGPRPARAVAGLSILERSLVAAHRAGCSPITVVAAGPLPPLRRAAALGLRFRVAAEPPGDPGPVLLIGDGMLVHPRDLQRVLSAGARLVDERGAPLPAGVAERADREVERAIADRPAIRALEAAGAPETEAGRQALERALLRGLGSSADGLMDRLLNRRIARPLVRLLVRTPLPPNAVTLLAAAVGLLAALLLAEGGRAATILGAALFVLSAAVDCADGELARALFKESRLGRWLDLVSDQAVHLALFLGIALGLHRSGSAAPALVLGAIAATGGLLSFLAVLRGMLRPSGERPSRLGRLIDAATNRDFAWLLLALALAGRLDLFLWLAAVGSHLFWMAVLAVQLLAGRTGPAGGARGTAR